jgi:hypothetical protein
MNSRKIQDRLYLSLGLSARFAGQSTDAFRPAGPHNPLDPQNRFLRLPAFFLPARGRENHANEYGEVLWHGTFDASYTRPGDYLVTDAATFFIASQDPLLPVLCVRTNRTISLARPGMQTGTGGNAYGGYTSGSAISLLGRWPASVLGDRASSSPTASLPSDTAVPRWKVLIPSPVGIVLSPGDLITDDLGRTATVTASELTYLGWRMDAKMATT